MLLIPALLLALPFLVVGACTRAVVRRLRPDDRVERWQEIVAYEPEIGWKPRSNLALYARGDDDFYLTTGRDGWRGTVSLAEADLVVVGDSFAFGHGADDASMYSAHCGDVRVKPIGSDGYDMVQGLLWLRRIESDLQGKTVAWFVYCGNDLYDNLIPTRGGYRKPFVQQDKTGKWQICATHVSPEPWPYKHDQRDLEGLAEMCCDTTFSRRAYDACGVLIEEAAEVCRRGGATLVVVSIPARAQLSRKGRRRLDAVAPAEQVVDDNRPDRRLAEMCRTVGVPFISLKGHLNARHYLLRDIHWRASGHRRVGRLLSELHLQLRETVEAPGDGSPS